LVVLRLGRTLRHDHLHLLLPGLAVVGTDLVNHGDSALSATKLVIELGVVESESNERSELCDESLVILTILIQILKID